MARTTRKYLASSFADLLDWLGPDAGQQYELIRSGLIRIFISSGFSDAEDLADETIDRVIKRLPDIATEYKGEKVRYFRGVARKIIQEAKRRKEIAVDTFPEPVPLPERTSLTYDCLLKCLELLPHEKRDLILDYYIYEGHDKIQHHRQMAVELGIPVATLRMRAHHTRRELHKCVALCEQNLAKQKMPRSAFGTRRQIGQTPEGGA